MRVVQRSEAGLRPARSRTSLSSSLVTAHWGGEGPGEIDHGQCAAVWRSWQGQHMDTDQLAPGGAADIAYNFGVCQHGYVFEGRGAGVRSAANGSSEANGASYAVVYIGGAAAPFTAEARSAFNDAAELLGASLSRGHRDWVGTGCPGDEIYNWVHQGAPDPEEEDDMNDQEREALNALSVIASEWKAFAGRFDPEGQGDYWRGQDELERLAKERSGGGGVSLEGVRADLIRRLS